MKNFIHYSFVAAFLLLSSGFSTVENHVFGMSCLALSILSIPYVYNLAGQKIKQAVQYINTEKVNKVYGKVTVFFSQWQAYMAGVLVVLGIIFTPFSQIKQVYADKEAAEMAKAKQEKEKQAKDAAEQAERMRQRKDERAEAEKHDAIFSGWDGSCRPLVKRVKEVMNDPSSFDHVKTAYVQDGNKYNVKMVFRGKNKFGAVVLSEVTAVVYDDSTITDLNME